MSEEPTLLSAESEAYFEQFDVANEAREIGNAIDIDLGAAWAQLHRAGELHEGTPRRLVGAPEFDIYDVARQSFTFTSYKACARALREIRIFSSQAYMDTYIFQAIGATIIGMIGTEHRNLRAVVPRPKSVALPFRLAREFSWLTAPPTGIRSGGNGPANTTCSVKPSFTSALAWGRTCALGCTLRWRKWFWRSTD